MEIDLKINSVREALGTEFEALKQEFEEIAAQYEKWGVSPPHALALGEVVTRRVRGYTAAQCLNILKHVSPELFDNRLNTLREVTREALLLSLAGLIPEREREF